MMGSVRLVSDASGETGEYAILVRSDLNGFGLGWELMRLMIEWARHEGLRTVEGQVLRENAVMLTMCRKLGFQLRSDPDDADLMEVKLSVDAETEPALLSA
jgi:acetyltransferase